MYTCVIICSCALHQTNMSQASSKHFLSIHIITYKQRKWSNQTWKSNGELCPSPHIQPITVEDASSHQLGRHLPSGALSAASCASKVPKLLCAMPKIVKNNWIKNIKWYHSEKQTVMNSARNWCCAMSICSLLSLHGTTLSLLPKPFIMFRQGTCKPGQLKTTGCI